MPSPNNYPALFGALAQAVLALVVAAGLHLTTNQTGVILACVTAGVGLVVGLLTSEFSVALLTGFVNAVITAGLAFGIHGITSSTVSMVDALIVAIGAFFIHSQVSPKLDTRKA